MGVGVEEIILAAIERGELDNLEGQGKPLNLRDESAVHSEYRMANRILKNAGVPSEEVTMRKRIQALRVNLKEASDKEERLALQKEIAGLDSLLNLKLEKLRKR